jgi:acyl-CoA thioesterase YciA
MCDNAELISKEMFHGKQLGINNNIFGGDILSKIDECGYIYSSEKSNCKKLVTLSIDKVTFKKPIKVGDVIYFYGKILKFGNSSLTIKIEAKRKLIDNTQEEVVCETEMIFVRIDDNGKPLTINSIFKDEWELSNKK